jgi:hypothetical protein
VILLLASVADADVSFSCAASQVTATVPTNGATGVPIDARPAVLITAPGCAGPATWDLVLLRADDASEVAAGSFPADATDGLLELFPDVALDADTAYTFRATPDGRGEITEIGFTTGSGVVAGLDGGPTAVVDTATFAGRTGTLTVEWSAEPAADPDGLSIVTLHDPDLDVGIAVPASAATDVVSFWGVGGRPGDFCPEVSQIDGAGVATDPVSVECVHVTGWLGCDSTGGGPLRGAQGAGWLLACGLLARRRR